MSEQEIEVGETAALKTNAFTREHYDFAGWATSANGAVAYADGANYTVNAATDYTLFAKWTAKTYTITYELNGGTNASGNPSSYTVESNTITFANPTKSGHTFDGWYANSQCTVAYNSIPTGSGGNVTVYAKWTVNTNTLAFDGNGATGGSMAALTVNEGQSTAIPQNAFTKAGYTFAGWATSANGSVVYQNGGNIVVGETGVTLYAKWTANTNTLTFNANGGSGSMNAMSIKTDETKALTNNAFTKAGYTFAGWATSADGEVVYANGANYTMGTTGATLYAKWEANTNTLTFNANGGTGTMEPLSIKTGAKKVLTENAFTKEGYVFIGWATTSSGAVAYADGDEYTMGTANATLYAVWQKAVKLYVYYGTYGLPHRIYEVAEGSTITLEELYSDKFVTEDIKTCPIYNVYSGWRTGYFTHWAYENNPDYDTYKMVLEDISTAGEETISIIARYGSTATHNYLSHSNGTYTACPGGLGGVAYDLNTEKSVGSYQTTISLKKGAEGEVGIAFNMFMSNDKDQSQKVGDNYYYAALLPKDHSFVIGYVENGTWGGTVGTNLAYAGYNDVPEFFNGYYGLLGAGVTATFTLRVEVTEGKVEMFVSNFGGEQTAEVKVFTYENEALGKDGYSGWGIRAWGAEYTYTNVQYTASGQ